MRMFKLSTTMIAFVLFLAACGNNDATYEVDSEIVVDDKIYELTINSYLQAEHHANKNGFEPWIKLVEERTDGRVKVNYYTGGSLGGLSTSLGDVKGGAYDIGIIVPGYVYDTELFPLTIAEMPFAFPTIEDAYNVTKAFIEKHVEDISDEIMIIGAPPTDPYALVSKVEVTNLEEIQNLEIRVPGAMAGNLIQNWEATPMSITNAEMYEALQRGTVEAAIMPINTMISSSYYEVASYVADMAIYNTYQVPIMSRSFYNSLPNDLQTIFDELIPELARLMTESYISQFENTYANLKQLGVEIITLPEDDLHILQEVAEPIWDQWIEDANQKGYPGDEMMEDFKQMIQDANLRLPFS